MFEDARRLFKRSLDILEAEGTSLELAHTLCDYGNFCRTEGNFNDAEIYLNRSLQLYQEMGYEPGIALALRRFGHVVTGKDSVFDYPRARSFYMDSAQRWKVLGNKSELAQTLIDLGQSYTLTGQYAEARVACRESLAISRELHDLWNVARGLNLLGWLEFSAGEINQARTYLEESLEMFRDCGMKSYIAVTLFNLAELARYQGDYSQALILLDTTLVMADEMGNKQDQVWAELSKGFVLLRLQDSNGAGKILKEGLLLCREINSIYDSAIALIGLAGVSVDDGDAKRAAQLLGIAQAMIESTTMAIAGNPADLIEYENICNQVRGQLDELIFNREEQIGRVLAAEGLDATFTYLGYDD